MTLLHFTIVVCVRVCSCALTLLLVAFTRHLFSLLNRNINFIVPGPGVLPPAAWLVAFVDHVSVTYELTVFDATFRPPEQATEAVTRRGILARNFPAYIQAVVNLPEEAKGWWYTEASLKDEVVLRHGEGSHIEAALDKHPDLLASLFTPQNYVLRREQNMTLRTCAGTRYLWVPKIDGSDYVQLSVQAAKGHQRPLTYLGQNADVPLLPRYVQAALARECTAAFQPPKVESSSSNSIFSAPRKRSSPGDITPPPTWVSAGAGAFSSFHAPTGVARSVRFALGNNGSFFATTAVNQRESSISFSVAGAAEASDFLGSVSAAPICEGYSSNGLRTNNRNSLDSYSAGFDQLNASAKVAAGWAAHRSIALPAGALGVLLGAPPADGGADGAASDGAASDDAASDEDAAQEISSAMPQVPAFFLFPSVQKPFEPPSPNGTFYSAKCEVVVLPQGGFAVGTATGAKTKVRAPGGMCVGCSRARASFVRRARRASKRTLEIAAQPKARVTGFGNEPWLAVARLETQAKRIATLQGRLRNKTEALVKAEGLLVLGVDENARLHGLMRDAAKVAGPTSRMTWIEENFAAGTVSTLVRGQCEVGPLSRAAPLAAG